MQQRKKSEIIGKIEIKEISDEDMLFYGDGQQPVCRKKDRRGAFVHP
jgi:hypothetical protein